MRISRKLIAAIALGLLSIVGLLTAHAAMAEPPLPPITPGQCAVANVDAHGNVISYTMVPKGTRVGLMYCGADGDWHLGVWVDERSDPAPTTTTKPVVTVPRVDARRLSVSKG